MKQENGFCDSRSFKMLLDRIWIAADGHRTHKKQPQDDIFLVVMFATDAYEYTQQYNGSAYTHALIHISHPREILKSWTTKEPHCLLI